jgi:hypothetical protein
MSVTTATTPMPVRPMVGHAVVCVAAAPAICGNAKRDERGQPDTTGTGVTKE